METLRDRDHLNAMMRKKKILDRELIGQGSIVGLGVGLNGSGDGLAYLVYLDKRKMALEGGDVPDAVGGFPTRIVELDLSPDGGPALRPGLGTDHDFYNPLVGGIAITDLSGLGTLGLVVRREGSPDDKYMLTCAHVLAGEARDVYQPDTDEKDFICARTVATVYGNFSVPRDDVDVEVFVDIGLAKIDPDRRTATEMEVLAGPINGAMRIVPGLLGRIVFKRGCETGLTGGTIESIATTLVNPHTGEELKNLLIVESPDHDPHFGEDGDSGSLVYTITEHNGSVLRGAIGIFSGRSMINDRHFGVIPVDAIMHQTGVEFPPGEDATPVDLKTIDTSTLSDLEREILSRMPWT